MKFAEYPFVRYLPFFMGGILLYPWLPSGLNYYLALLLGFTFSFYLIVVWLNLVKGVYRFKVFPPLLAYLQLFLLGAWLQSEKKESEDQALLTPLEGMRGYTAVVLDNSQEKPNSQVNRFRVKEIFFNDTVLKSNLELLVYHRLEFPIKPGDLVWVPQGFQRIDAPLNPQEFNYQLFMGRQGVYFRQFIFQDLQVIGTLREQPIENFFQRLRYWIQRAFDGHFEDNRARQIANALLIGQKKDLEKEISEAYATAGAMHILAVSGLHVGIIYGFFFLWVKPYRLVVKQRALYLSGIILLIWCYALLTGMSPSVMRSATMFTIIALAQIKSRSPSIFNAIAFSALLLLLFDPLLVFSVGFQLSYCALLGILLIQPLIVKLWMPPWKVLDYCWQITSVGIAAQLATFPLSAMYFGIFPTYFMLSNLVAIPGAFLIMSVGVPYMLFSSVPYLSVGLGWATELLIRWMNALIVGIQYLPASKLTIDWNASDTWFYISCLVLILMLCYYPRKYLVGVLIILCLGIPCWRLWEKAYAAKESWMVQYAVGSGEAFDFFARGHRYSWEVLSEADRSFKVAPYRRQNSSQAPFPLQMLSKDSLSYFLIPNIGLVPKDSLVYLASQRYQFDGKDWQFLRPDEIPTLEKGAFKLKFDANQGNSR